jgi:hypothetical protein
MAGLDPAIHVFPGCEQLRKTILKTRMPGTKAGHDDIL